MFPNFFRTRQNNVKNRVKSFHKDTTFHSIELQRSLFLLFKSHSEVLEIAEVFFVILLEISNKFKEMPIHKFSLSIDLSKLLLEVDQEYAYVRVMSIQNVSIVVYYARNEGMWLEFNVLLEVLLLLTFHVRWYKTKLHFERGYFVDTFIRSIHDLAL